MSFRELVIHCQPDNMKAILDLIDQNLADWPPPPEEEKMAPETEEMESPMFKQVELATQATASVKDDTSNLLVPSVQLHFPRAMVIFFIISGTIPQIFLSASYKILIISRSGVGSYFDRHAFVSRVVLAQ